MTPDLLPSDLIGLLSEANRPIRLRMGTSQGVLDDLLLVKHVSGVEAVCGGIEYSLLCVSSNAGMELKQFIANPAEIQFVTDTGGLHPVCGIVVSVAEGQCDGGLATYQLIIRDAFSLLDETCNTRVFRDASEVEIIATLIKEYRGASAIVAQTFDVDFSRLKSYPARSFTMQYNESTAAFIRRLLKRRGIAWFFEAGPATQRGSANMPTHKMILFDDPMSLTENAAGPARYHRDHATEARDSITAWHGERTVKAGLVTRRSGDYVTAWSMGSEDFSTCDQGPLGNALAASLDHYLIDPPHAGDDADDYRRLGTLRMQRKEYEAKVFKGEGGDRNTYLCQWRRINGHPDIDSHPANEREFVVTELRIEAENNLGKTFDDKVRRLFATNHWHIEHIGLAQASAERGMRYTNRFRGVRRGIPIVPSFDPRTDVPRAEAQTVTVVGPVHGEVHCDELGRVKVRFPGCRPHDHEHAHGAGASDSDRDSSWLRPVTLRAGDRSGTSFLPLVGDEELVIFVGGDPDKPVLLGGVHNGKALPPSFDHTSILPGDRHLSGIVSKEGNGLRANQLCLDDTPGQISANLESEHAHSQLNLGYLTHPRHNGKAEPRGEGAELRTDASLALRGGQGVLISADASLRAAGRQLERNGLAGLAEALIQIQKQVAEVGQTHEAGDVDCEPLKQLSGHVKQWEHGSNTEVAATGSGGGAPVVAIEAPAGLLLGSQANVSMGAQTHVDVISVGNTQVSAGRKLMLHALQGLSLFAHALGAKLIAASGKIELQAHDDDVEITAAKRIVLVASEEIVMQAPKVTIVTKGAQCVYGEGAISQQCTGSFSVKSASADFTSGGDGEPITLRMPKSAVAHDQRVRMVDMSTGDPLVNQRYRVTMEDGQIQEGKTDDQGLTEVLSTEIPFGHFTIEALYD